MRDFEYEAPVTLTDAVNLLSVHAGRAKPLAGGTDLIDYIRTGRLEPDVVVDIKRIPELQELCVGKNSLRLGAAVCCREIYENSEIKAKYSALTDACSIVGGIQIQNRASVGGNLCTSGAAADSVPALIALNAGCVIAGPNSVRSVLAEDFCTGPATNVLEPDEILVAMIMPSPAPSTGSHYRRFIPRNEMDIAVVGVGASVTIDDAGLIAKARVGLGAVSGKPFLATEVNEFLVGKLPTAETFQEAGELARTLISPINDHRGTVEFRTHVTGVLVQRVLTTAAERAQTK